MRGKTLKPIKMRPKIAFIKRTLPKVFGICQYNISIGNQPHSEVAALAVFLQTWKPNGTHASNFSGGLTVVPMESGKQILSSEEITE